MSATRRQRIVVTFLVAALAVASMYLAGVVYAQAGGLSANSPPPGSLRLQARAGFDGQGRVGGWVPLAAEVVNEAPVSFGGELRVRVTSGPNRGTFSNAPTVYTLPVAVPGRTHRRFSLDVRIPTAASRTEAELVASGSGEVLAEQDVPMARVPLGELFCGVVGRDARSYDFLAALDLPPPIRRARVVPVATAELPAVGHLLGSFDCLILDGANSTQLRPDQIEALQVWLNGGGLLLAVGGTGWRANLAALPPSLLPVEPQGLASVESLDALEALAGETLEQAGPWLVTRARLRDGAGAGRVLASQEGIPLVVAAKRGDGGVIYLAFEPTSPALLSWPGQGELWRYLLTHASIDSGTGSSLVRPYLRWGRVPRWALTDYSTQPRPEAGWLLALSSLAAVAGAAAVLLLGAWRRPGRAALALAGIGLVSTGAAFALALARAEPDVQVSQVSVIRPVALGEAAYARTYVSAWPQRSDSYTFQLPTSALSFSLWYPSPRPNDESDVDWAVTAVETQAPQIRDLPLARSRLSTFGFDGQVASAAVRLETDLALDVDSRLHGTVTNALGQRLENLALVVDTQVVPLGALGPGQSVSVDTSAPMYASTGYVASQALPVALLGEPPRGQPPSAQRDLLDSLFTQRFLVRRTELRGPTLIGWLPRDPLEVALVGGGSASVRSGAVLLAPAGVRLPLGYQGPVPASLMTRRDLGGAPTFAPDRDFYSVSPGEAISLQLTLPAAEGPWDVDALLVNLGLQVVGTRLSPSLAELQRVGLFNWRTGDWQDWQLGATSARIPEPQDFVSATGDVRLRYRLDSGVAGRVRQVNISRFDVTPVVRVANG